MSKKEKLMKKFLTVPVRNDLTFNELMTLLEALGFKMVEGNGSRVKFFHNEKKLIVSTHKPHPKPDLFEEFIKDVQQILKFFK